MQFLTTSPGRKRNPCLPLRAMDFPKLYVLKHLVNEMCGENNARRVGQTHNNKRHPFSAHGFTCTGMKILRVKIGNVSFTLGKLTSFGTQIGGPGCPRHQ